MNSIRSVIGCALQMKWTANAQVGGPSKATLKDARKTLILSLALIGGFLCTGALEAASVTITGPATLQTQFIADTTNQWNATVTPSAFFAGSYTINLISKKPPIIIGPVPCTLDESIQAIKDITLQTYPYGFAGGQQYERASDLSIIATAGVSCSTNTVCSGAITQAYQSVYQQNFSTPTVIIVP